MKISLDNKQQDVILQNLKLQGISSDLLDKVIGESNISYIQPSISKIFTTLAIGEELPWF